MLDQRNHIVELQSLRGLAALIVVSSHCFSYYATPKWFVAAKNILFNGQGAVVLFFVLSGFVLGRSLGGSDLDRRSLAAFYLKRLFRIYPALWAASALGLAYVLFFHFTSPHPDVSAWFLARFKADRMTPIGYTAAFLGVLGLLVPPVWTIFNEIVGSAVLPFTARLSSDRLHLGVALALVLAAVSVTIGQYTYYGFLLYPVDFQVGVLVAVLSTKKPEPRPPSLVWAISLCVGVLTVTCLRGVALMVHPGLTQFNPILHAGELLGAAAIMVAVIANPVSILRSLPIKALGDISYSVYLLHFPIMCFVGIALARLLPRGGSTPAETLALFTATMAATIPLAMAAYRIIERPSVALGKRLASLIQGAGAARVGRPWRPERDYGRPYASVPPRPPFTYGSPASLGRLAGGFIAAIPVINYVYRPNYQGVNLYDPALMIREVAPPIVSVLSTFCLLGAFAVSLFAALTARIDYNRQRGMAALSIALTAFACLSGMTSGAPTMPLVLITLFIAFVMAINIAALDRWEPFFATFAATAVLLFMVGDLLALTSHDYKWGRLGGHVGGNYWGLISGSALTLSLLLRPAWLRVPVALVALATLYLGQSRGSEVATILGLVAMALLKLRAMPARRSVLFALGGLLLVIVLVATFEEQIARKIFLVDDAYRGAASAGSGRLIGWAETLNIIAAHPLFGVGLRQHEQYLHSVSNAHNAYLAVTAEQGFIGLIIYLLMTLGGLVRAAVAYLGQRKPIHLVIVGYLTFFMSVGMFEQFSLATGNPASLIAFIAVALAWRNEQGAPSSVPIRRPVSGGPVAFAERRR